MLHHESSTIHPAPDSEHTSVKLPSVEMYGVESGMLSQFSHPPHSLSQDLGHMILSQSHADLVLHTCNVLRTVSRELVFAQLS